MDFSPADALYVAAQLPESEPTRQELEHIARNLVARKAQEALQDATDFVQRQASHVRNSRYLQEQAQIAQHYLFGQPDPSSTVDHAVFQSWKVPAHLFKTFCREFGLSESSMLKVAKGQSLSHKGWIQDPHPSYHYCLNEYPRPEREHPSLAEGIGPVGPAKPRSDPKYPATTWLPTKTYKPAE